MESPDLSTTGVDAAHSPVLVVEDDPLLGTVLSRIVEQCKGSATVVGTARDAMDQLMDVREWSALIVDVRLPDCSGLDVLGRLRDVRRDIPALVLTGFPERDVANAAFDLGAAYLVKPTNPGQLRHFLRAIRRRSEDSGPRLPSPNNHAASDALPDSVDLPEDLQWLTLDVLDAADKLGSAHSEYAYRMALLARASSGRTHGGCSAIGACAKAAKISRSAFQDYIAVTTRWKPSELRSLLGRRDRYGRAVTLSHLLLVVRAPGALRAEMERVIREGSDLRLLRALGAAFDKKSKSSPA
jgi:DNA-binding response OmpR family regulator